MSNPTITTIFKGKGGVGGTTTALNLATAKSIYQHRRTQLEIPDPADLDYDKAQQLLGELFDLERGAYQNADGTIEDRGRVLLIDADKGTRSIDRFTARRTQTHDLTERLPFLVDKWTPDKGLLTEYIADAYEKYERPDEIVIDMGADPEYAAGAALMANCILMPVKAWSADYDTLVDLKSITAKNAKADAYVLLTMVDSVGKGEAANARKDITAPPRDDGTGGFGMTLLETEIKKHQAYRLPYETGSTPDPLWAYLSVLAEIEGFGPVEGELNPGSSTRAKG